MTSGEPAAIVRTPGGNRDVSVGSVTGAVLGGREPPARQDICEVRSDHNDFENGPQGDRQQYHP
jgi:hypothetical protein